MFVRRSLLGSSSHAIKSHNLRAILLTLLRYDTVSRVRIAELTGLSTTTVTNLITELLEQGIVVQEGSVPARRGVGRPRTGLRLVPEARYAVGVHIGVGTVRVALTNLFAQPLTTQTITYPLERPAADVLDSIISVAHDLIAHADINHEHIIGVGVGASGMVDPYTGVNILAPNLGWRDIPIRDHLSPALKLPVFVDNNVRAMAMSEALFGAGQDVRVLAFVYGRVGLGAGFVIDGQLFRGRSGAGEIGHITVMAANGDACRCGNTGCLETLVSETAILRLADAITAAHPDGVLARQMAANHQDPIDAILNAARAGDAPTRAMLDDRARYMGIGLANLVNTLSPELIIVGGIFEQGHDLLFPIVEETIRQRAFAGMGDDIRLQTPTFGADAGMIGAAALALDAFFYEQSEVIL